MPELDVERATAREDLCRFLAACYYEPEPMLQEEAVFASLAGAADLLSPQLAEPARRLGACFAAQDLQDLLVDYTRLFMGPPAALARPYGSVWLGCEPRVMDASTLAVVELYRSAGFGVDEDLREAPDHIALELEFLYLLTFHCNEAARAGDAEALARWEGLRSTFLNEHLGAWAGRFAQAVQANAATAFYRELAGLTASFVQMERDALPGR